MAVLGRGKKRAEANSEKLLDVTANMEGSLIFNEPVTLRISGGFSGNLKTRGSLTIGEQAQVSAKIDGEEITIAGLVTGKVTAKKSLKLVPPAVVSGQIYTPILEVEAGAKIEGEVHVGEIPSWMTSKEVAEYLEVELRLIEEWALEGRVPGVQEGDQWRFEKAKIDEWVATQKN